MPSYPKSPSRISGSPAKATAGQNTTRTSIAQSPLKAALGAANQSPNKPSPATGQSPNKPSGGQGQNSGLGHSPAKAGGVAAQNHGKSPTKHKLGRQVSTVASPARNDINPSPTPSKGRPGGEDFSPAGQGAVRPSNQLVLAEKELAEEVARTLTSASPAAPHNLVRYNFRERQYKPEPLVEHVIVHYAAEGSLQYNGAAEATDAARPPERTATDPAGKLQAEAEAATPGGGPRLRNQFNFCERAAQTPVYPPVHRLNATEPPLTATVSGSCTPSQLYDAYVEDQERQRHDYDLKREKAAAAKKGSEEGSEPSPPVREATATVQGQEGDKSAAASLECLAGPLEVIERMLDQNSLLSLIMDFKYWNDPADTVREGEGTLLPLWSFEPERVGKHKHVTALLWNPAHWDLFAVGYGSYAFHNQGRGGIAIYSLKKPSHPEITISTDSGVMCMDFHPEHPSLLAVGLYDGRVAVYDLQAPHQPLYSCSAASGKHTDVVWQMRWQPDDAQKEVQLVSVSEDSRITLWTLAKNELLHQDVMLLRMTAAGSKTEPDEDTTPDNLAAGCSIDFNPEQEHMFVVGTEEGAIHKCSTAYNSEYLASFDGHAGAVHKLHWNPLKPNVFLSASADWTVCMWDSGAPSPVMTFDLGSPVGDVAWAPGSATTFAAVTEEGHVVVYDLAVDKRQALCEQRIIRKGQLTHLAFNSVHPVLLVGDDRGKVTCLKLSPNLRQLAKAETRQKACEAEVAKLEKALEVVRKENMAP